MLNAASGLGLGFASYAIYSIINRLSLVSSAPRSATERNYESLAKVGPEASLCMDVRNMWWLVYASCGLFVVTFVMIWI